MRTQQDRNELFYRIGKKKTNVDFYFEIKLLVVSVWNNHLCFNSNVRLSEIRSHISSAIGFVGSNWL